MTAQEHLQEAERLLESLNRHQIAHTLERRYQFEQAVSARARAHAAIAHTKLIEELLMPKEPSNELPPLRPEAEAEFLKGLGLNDEGD